MFQTGVEAGRADADRDRQRLLDTISEIADAATALLDHGDRSLLDEMQLAYEIEDWLLDEGSEQ